MKNFKMPAIQLLLMIVLPLTFVSKHSFAKLSKESEVPATASSAQYYEKFQVVPSRNKTAEKLVMRFAAGRIAKRQVRRVEDVVIIMDGSESISACEFNKGKKAMSNMMTVVATDTKYAAVSFGSTASVQFNFLPNPSAATKLLQIPYPDGATNTQAALVEAKGLFNNPQSGRRVFSHKIVLLVTDGQSNVDRQLTIKSADALKSMGVEIFVVAVGDYIDGIEELVNVASNPPEQHLFRATSLSRFDEVVKLVLKKVAPAKYQVVAGQYEPPCLKYSWPGMFIGCRPGFLP